MSVSDNDLRWLTIDLIAPARVPDPSILAMMAEGDWQVLTAMARQHRVLPLLHARLRNPAIECEVPDALRMIAAEAFARKSLSTIRARRTLVLAVRALATAGIAPVAMKGAYLAFHAYAESGLRPLRDIDLLVPVEVAVDAYHCLMGSGFAPINRDVGDIDAYLKIKHQLPALRCTATGTTLELHHRAFHGTMSDPDLSYDPDFAVRLVRHTVGDVQIAYMGPEHLLLHLIVHSARDHRFDNGPGIFADVDALTGTHSLDWPYFWSLAERHDAVRAAVLVLRMVERLWGTTAVEWDDRQAERSALPEAMVDLTVQLSLRELDRSSEAGLLARFDGAGGFRAKVQLVASKLFPPPTVLRAAYANRGRAIDLPVLYLRKWIDLSGRRFSAYAGSLASDTARADRERLGALSRWFDADDHLSGTG